MNLLQQLRALDINDIGRWPLIFRVAFIILIFVAVTSGGLYYFVFNSQTRQLERVQAKETELRNRFEAKQRLAANFDAYKIQLEEMRRSFGDMLRQLPGETEIPSLLTDISQAGLAAGLEEKLFQPNQEVQKDFYAELPIRIQLNGSYHEFGEFVSDIAALPRIVTLHNISIAPAGDNRRRREARVPSADVMLELNVTAKTYRYLEGDGDEAAAGSGP